VIELLRKKGYTLRPVIMQDREATRKDTIDKIRCRSAFLPLPPRQRITVQLPESFTGVRTDARPTPGNMPI